MDYQKHYNLLISRAQARILPEVEYKESHHIIPKCLGGSDDQTNIAVLTPEEHYLAHQLLVKMHPKNYKVAVAALFMTTGRHEKRNNKLHGWLRRKISEARKGKATFTGNHSNATKQKIGDAHRGRPKSDEHKKKLSESQKGIKRGPMDRDAAKRSAASRTGRKQSPEEKAMRSERLKAYYASKREAMM